MSFGLALGALTPVWGQSGPDFEQPPVSYSKTEPNDALTRVKARIATGELKFEGGERQVLAALLKALDVPAESQLLVFSKTSLQRSRIRPERPRALYFSDDVYVGWVPGGMIEVAAVDPQLGPVFYSFEAGAVKGAAPEIVRDADCMRCHGGTFVRDVPGVIARSVFPSVTGEPLLRFGSTVVDDQTPFEQRWGGWYVTGYRGAQPHRGNTFGVDKDGELIFTPVEKRPGDVAGLFDSADYLAQTSDVVALLVFEHQMAMQNALTHASFAARRMLAYQKSLQEHFKEQAAGSDDLVFDSVKSVFASEVENVVDRLLFREEAALPEGVEGSAAFRASFAQGAPRSAAGHALKDLALNGHMFAQRCSYLIYSETFRTLPAPLKGRILDRLGDVLLGGGPKDRYAYLGAEERRRIFEILIETHPDAKARWAERKPAG
ncbi:MAG: hypothetical protein V4773_17335 [Verrucomicrobiota bacterium]